MPMILFLGNAICGLDFNPLGTLTASIDAYGVCLISDIDTNDYIFHLKMDKIYGNCQIFFSLYYKNLLSFSLQANNICLFHIMTFTVIVEPVVI